MYAIKLCGGRSKAADLPLNRPVPGFFCKRCRHKVQVVIKPVGYDGPAPEITITASAPVEPPPIHCDVCRKTHFETTIWNCPNVTRKENTFDCAGCIPDEYREIVGLPARSARDVR